MTRTMKGWRGDTWIACDEPAVMVFYGVENLTMPVPVCQRHFEIGEEIRKKRNPNWRERNLYRKAEPGELCCQPKLEGGS